MEKTTFLRKLKGLSQLKNNWHSVASVIVEAKETWSEPSRRMREASDASGYSINLLRRMVAVREFLDSVRDGVQELQGIDPNRLSFASVELIKRLHQIDPEAALKMLIASAKGRLTVRELREYYNKVVSEHSQGVSAQQTAKLDARDFRVAAYAAIELSLFSELLRGVDISEDFEIKGSKWPIEVLGFNDRNMTSAPVVGFELVMSPGMLKDHLVRKLHRVLFHSSFCTRFWVILGSDVGEERINDFCSMLDELEKQSVGVAVLPWGEDNAAKKAELTIVRRPSGDPWPDYRHKYSSVIRDFIPRWM